MNKIIQQLIDDHCRFLDVQAVLRNEMSVFSEGDEQRNIPLLLDIMDYFIGYSGVFHHGLEDRIYAKIRTSVVDSHVSWMLDSIEMQHAQMDVYSRRLQNDFNAIANNHIVSTGRIMADFKAYIDLSEEHVSCENTYLIPLIVQSFTGNQLEGVLRDVIDSTPQYFQKLDMYNRLFKQIQEEGVVLHEVP